MSGFVVAQMGARMHYAVPRMLHEAGRLARFYTDICAVRGWPAVLAAIPPAWRPSRLKRLLGRVPRGVPREKVTAFTGFGWEYARRRARAREGAEQIATHLWAGETFCRLINERGIGAAEGVYTFNTAGLEVLKMARAQGRQAVLEQTVPSSAAEHELLKPDYERFGDWERAPAPGGVYALMDAREKQEWQAADVILCPSEFTRQTIGAQGGPLARCQIVPYGVDPAFQLAPRTAHRGPLRVLFVGSVGLRKGAPYVLEAAKALKGRAIFRLVGPVHVSAQAAATLDAFVELVGPVPRSDIMRHYAWADVFLLPSLCEGSATAVYEALSAALPVVCTPNTGSVVREGCDGFLVPPRAPEAIVEKLERLAADAGLRAEMSRQALAGSAEYSLARYQARLLRALEALR